MILLLAVAVIVALMTQRLRIPSAAVLVIAGVALALMPHAAAIQVPPWFVYTALLPPLLFEAAFVLRWEKLRPELPVVLTLAIGGIVVAGAVTAAAMHWMTDWEWKTAVVFGALIAATDPVSVLATFRAAHAHGRLALLIEAESLLNDGVGAVALGVAVTFALGQQVSAAGIAARLLQSVAGGAISGAVIGFIALFLLGRWKHEAVEMVVTAASAWGSFLLAERLHASGVLAVIVAGLVIGNLGSSGSFTRMFWDRAAFVANALVFVLIGVYEARLGAVRWQLATAGVIAVLFGRAISVYGLCGVFGQSRLRVPAKQQHALVWGGVRGALGMALAIGLPAGVPTRDSIIQTTFAVVAFSVFVQGISMPSLLRTIGEVPRHGTGSIVKE